MISLDYIRKFPKSFDSNLILRGIEPQSQDILQFDSQKRSLLTKIQSLQHEKKLLSNEMRDPITTKEKKSEIILKSKELQIEIETLEKEEKDISDKLNDLLLYIPNILYENIPKGSEEKDNVEIKKIDTPKDFNFKIKSHEDIGTLRDLMDFENTVAISGSRFMSLKGKLAQLERALINFMVDFNIDNGYSEISHPALVLEESMKGTGQLPKFSHDSFKTTNNMRLIPTSEVFLTNMIRNKILSSEDLPIRLTAYSPCFRSEAGSAGKDTKGMMRLHQFNKVELVSIVENNQSFNELERMLDIIERMLQALKLPYRVVELCAGDTGFAAAKTYDLEVWVPSQETYREISSCSNCTDFQSRRLNARYKVKSSKEKLIPHTLNGSSLAVGRTILAIIENYQTEDLQIEIPLCLQKYMNGLTHI